jgi:hypothetical protein
MAVTESIPQTSCPDAGHDCLSHAERCPLCAGDNACRVAKGHLYKGACWCHQVIVPKALLSRLAEDSINPACLCRPCLETVARVARELDDSASILAEVRKVISARRQEETSAAEPDFYLDEFGNTVFTAAYHLKRGNCCGNQCQHCPY